MVTKIFHLSKNFGTSCHHHFVEFGGSTPAVSIFQIFLGITSGRALHDLSFTDKSRIKVRHTPK